MAGRRLGFVGGDEGDLAVCGAVVEELGALGRDGEERPGPRPAGGPLTGPEVVGDAGRVTGLPGLGLEDNLGRTKSQVSADSVSERPLHSQWNPSSERRQAAAVTEGQPLSLTE